MPGNVPDEAPPPYSETDIYSNSAASRSNPASASAPSQGEDAASRMSSSNDDIIYTPPDTPHIPNAAPMGIVQPGAAEYFESRPPLEFVPENVLIHTINVDANSLPDDLPYQSNWEKRDVNQQDWATFINFLLPDHMARGNEIIIDRKLQAETESEGGASEHSATARSQAEAQRDQLRQAAPDPQTAAIQRANAEATIQQWNSGFFGPRSMEIRLAPGQQSIPGAFPADAARDVPSNPPPANAPPSSWRDWLSNMQLQVDNEGVRCGNTFIADNNGLRVGSLIMDSNGIRMATSPHDVPVAESSSSAQNREATPTVPPLVPERGRNRQKVDSKGKGRERSLSASSVSSASTDSTESLESLPDYDEVREQQMPTFISILKEWVATPEHIRTNEDVDKALKDIKSSKSLPISGTVDKKTLKAEIRGLLHQWKQIQRQQKKTRREAKRLRRQQKRAEKRERRQQKRELRHSERDMRRGERKVRKQERRGHHNCAPLPPSNALMPPMPPAPPVPPAQLPFPDFSRGGFGNRGHAWHGWRGRGGGFGRGWGNARHACHGSQHEHRGRQGHDRRDAGTGPDELAEMMRGSDMGERNGSKSGDVFGSSSDIFKGKGVFGGKGSFNIEFEPDEMPPFGPPGSWPENGHGPGPRGPPGSQAEAKAVAANQLRTTIKQQQEAAANMPWGLQKAALKKSIKLMTAALERLDADSEEGTANTATALFDFNGVEEDELTFSMGARILDIEQSNDDWWFGSYNGKSGMFPANHVRLG